MDARKLRSLKSRLSEPLAIPIIGRCLQKKAVKVLAEDGSPNAVKILAEVVIKLKEEEIKASIFNILNNIKTQECINSFSDVWANTRDGHLTNILLKKGWVASTPADIKVLTALKTNRLQAIANDGVEIIEPLLNSFNDRDPEIANRASQCALSLTNSEAIDVICRLAVEQDHQLAYQIAMKAQYAPHEPSQRALFCFLTEQWDKYESLDYEHTLLQKVYELGNENLRKQIADKARQAGRVEWIQIVGGGRKGNRLGEMTDAEWKTAITVLSQSKNWEEMWRLAQKAPAIWSRKLLLELNQVTGLPLQELEKNQLEKLTHLATKCSLDISQSSKLIQLTVEKLNHEFQEYIYQEYIYNDISGKKNLPDKDWENLQKIIKNCNLHKHYLYIEQLIKQYIFNSEQKLDFLKIINSINKDRELIIKTIDLIITESYYSTSYDLEDFELDFVDFCYVNKKYNCFFHTEHKQLVTTTCRVIRNINLQDKVSLNKDINKFQYNLFTKINEAQKQGKNLIITINKLFDNTLYLNWSASSHNHDYPIYYSRLKESSISLSSFIDLFDKTLDKIIEDRKSEQYILILLQTDYEKHKNWLDFMQELINWHKRFDFELEDVPQLVNTNEFDIEIEG